MFACCGVLVWFHNFVLHCLSHATNETATNWVINLVKVKRMYLDMQHCICMSSQPSSSWACPKHSWCLDYQNRFQHIVPSLKLCKDREGDLHHPFARGIIKLLLLRTVGTPSGLGPEFCLGSQLVPDSNHDPIMYPTPRVPSRCVQKRESEACCTGRGRVCQQPRESRWHARPSDCSSTSSTA
jgi:hypothetical protein